MRNIDQKYYCSNYYASVNIYGVKFGTSLRIWENRGWINKIDPSWWFQCYFRYFLGRRSLDDERQINRRKGIATRFKDKLIKMSKDTGSKFDDYSISPEVIQILLHWGYELVESDLLWFFSLTILYCIKMSEKTKTSDNIEVNKKEFHKSEQPIGLALVNVDQIVMSDKFKHDEDGFKHFIDYKEDNIAGLLCIVLPQMRWYIKYFENGGKNMSFIIQDDDDVLVKHNDIWNKIKKILNIKFHGMSVYYENT